MKKFLLIFFFMLVGVHAFGQQYIMGKITNADDDKLSGVTVVNLNTGESTVSTSDGTFVLKAAPAQEVRFIRSRFERVSKVLTAENFRSPMAIVLMEAPVLIEEVELGFQATGNLKKDVAMLESSARTKKLNADMNKYMKTKPETAYPALKPPVTLQTGPSYTAGQVDMIAIAKGIRTIVKKIRHDEPTTANYKERQQFYARIKAEIDMSYFQKYGLDEYEFDALMLYADNKYDLSATYRNKFNINTIQSYLRSALKEFMDTELAQYRRDTVAA